MTTVHTNLTRQLPLWSKQYKCHVGKRSAGRRRLELFGEDHNIRPGWVTVGSNLTSSNFNPQVCPAVMSCVSIIYLNAEPCIVYIYIYIRTQMLFWLYLNHASFAVPSKATQLKSGKLTSLSAREGEQALFVCRREDTCDSAAFSPECCSDSRLTNCPQAQCCIVIPLSSILNVTVRADPHINNSDFNVNLGMCFYCDIQV